MNNLPQTAQEYMNLVHQFSALVEKELEVIESAASQGDYGRVASRLPQLISTINCIGYLRGQDNMFTTIRPSDVTEFQKELYANENMFEERLQKLIDAVVVSPEKEKYLYNLDSYFIKART